MVFLSVFCSFFVFNVYILLYIYIVVFLFFLALRSEKQQNPITARNFHERELLIAGGVNDPAVLTRYVFPGITRVALIGSIRDERAASGVCRLRGGEHLSALAEVGLRVGQHNIT